MNSRRNPCRIPMPFEGPIFQRKMLVAWWSVNSNVLQKKRKEIINGSMDSIVVQLRCNWERRALIHCKTMAFLLILSCGMQADWSFKRGIKFCNMHCCLPCIVCMKHDELHFHGVPIVFIWKGIVVACRWIDRNYRNVQYSLISPTPDIRFHPSTVSVQRTQQLRLLYNSIKQTLNKRKSGSSGGLLDTNSAKKRLWCAIY